MTCLNLTVTWTTYSLTVGGDSSESSTDAENSKTTSSWKREGRISCTTETGTKESGINMKIYILMTKEIVLYDNSNVKKEKERIILGNSCFPLWAW